MNLLKRKSRFLFAITITFTSFLIIFSNTQPAEAANEFIKINSARVDAGYLTIAWEWLGNDALGGGLGVVGIYPSLNDNIEGMLGTPSGIVALHKNLNGNPDAPETTWGRPRNDANSLCQRNITSPEEYTANTQYLTQFNKIFDPILNEYRAINSLSNADKLRITITAGFPCATTGQFRRADSEDYPIDFYAPPTSSLLPAPFWHQTLGNGLDFSIKDLTIRVSNPDVDAYYSGTIYGFATDNYASGYGITPIEQYNFGNLGPPTPRGFDGNVTLSMQGNSLSSFPLNPNRYYEVLLNAGDASRPFFIYGSSQDSYPNGKAYYSDFWTHRSCGPYFNPETTCEPGANNGIADIFFQLGTAETLLGKERAVTTDITTQANAVIDGDIIAWMDWINPGGGLGSSVPADIYVYEISTGRKIRVTNDNTVKDVLMLADRKILWTVSNIPYLNSRRAVFIYDLETATTTEITAGFTKEAGIRDIYISDFDGQRIVWKTDYEGSVPSIYIYDLTTSQSTLIDRSTFVNYTSQVVSNPKISGDKILYKWFWNCGTWCGQEELRLYDITTGEKTKILNNYGFSSDYAIDGDNVIIVVYGQPALIYRYKISTGEMTNFAPVSRQITGLDISGNIAVWSDTNDIFIYDIATGLKGRAGMASRESLYPKISGNTIVWDDYRNSNADIYMYQINNGSSAPPPNAVPVPATSSPITIESIPKNSKPGTLLNVIFNIDTNTISYNPVFNTNDLNPDFFQKPTTIIVHGWNNPGGSAELPPWVKSMSSWLAKDELKRTNVLVWEWLEEASTLLPPSEYLMEQQGDYLADKLSNIFKTSGYANKIHFIGHSAGARVAYTAGANLIANNIPVDLLTTLDAYMFDAVEFTADLTIQALTGVSTNDFLKNTESFFKFYPLNLFNFVDNYWFIVGAFSYKAELGFLSNSIFSGVNPLIVDGLVCPPGLKDKITNPSYFIENNILDLDDLHKPPVNWYMASMVNHLPVSLLKPSPNNSKHNYGFYWSPIFNNERPNKLDIDLLFGCESYFDLIGSPTIVSDAVVKFGELVEMGIDLTNRLKERAKTMGKNLIIKATDELSDASGWISNKSNAVYHYAENNLNGWLWATTQSPTVFSKNYLIPSDAGWLGFSYEVLQGGQESTLEVFINETLIFYKIFKQEKTNGIILSDLIDVSNWSGDNVRLSFRINGSNVAPFIIKMHDIFFAEIEFMPKDSDNDNILDVWELLYWNDLSHSGDSDFDNDGLNNMDEFLFGTNPTKFNDIIAPTTDISILGILGNNDWHTSDVEIILSAKDNEGGVGVEKTLYSLNDEKWNTYSTTSPIRIANEGIYTIQYYSTDWFGNKEATTTLTIKIDKTPPEAKIFFDQNLKQLKIKGIDNLSSVAVVQNENNYTLTDEAGHTLAVDFDKLKTEGKEIKAEISELRYDGISIPAISKNKLQYEWSLEKDGGIKELNQRIEAEKIFDIRARYNAKKNETVIDIKTGDEEDEKKTKQTFIGFTFLILTTHSGNLDISYDH